MFVRKVILSLLFVSLLCIGSLRAQVSFFLTWDSVNVPAPNVQASNDTVLYTLTLNNGTGSQFFDSLYFHLRTSLGTWVIASFDSTLIAPFGTKTFSFRDSTLSSRYGGGVNVVVIWPTSPSQIQTDSLIDSLTILLVDVDPLFSEAIGIDVFPIPSQMEIFFRQHDHSAIVISTEIQNLEGQVLRRIRGLPDSLSVAELPSGMYFIRFLDDLGRNTVIKVVKN